MNTPTTGLRISEADRDAQRAWVDENPLRLWRKSQTPKLAILDAAGLLHVGMSMLSMYERGLHKPSGDRRHRFDEILGRGWESEWDLWLARKPTVGRAAGTSFATAS